MTTKEEIAKAVQQRAKDLLVKKPRQPLDDKFVKQCLDANERGDGCLFASLHKWRFFYNTTPKDGEWYVWTGNVWEIDDFRASFAAVEDVAIEYQRAAEPLKKDIKDNGIDKKHQDAWKLKLLDKYNSRVDRVRGAAGVGKVLVWAPVVDPDMACRESDLNKHPWLLPVKNGVIDLRTGALTTGRPEDLLTKSLDIEYDPHADYAPWQEFVDEVSGDHDVASFIKRTMGYSITGHSYEQYIWVFTGPGRNGKGILFNMIGDVMGPYYHEINRGMIIEQRNEPSPSAASEHKYSLLGKRIIVGAETNKGQKIDASAIKSLTGEDKITCRPLFKSEISFSPSHTVFLHTNHIPHGLTRDFAMVQRLIKIEFPYMYVDNIEAEKKKYPGKADRFRQKDPHLKEKLRAVRHGILRWLVEGCLEWQERGLDPPKIIIDSVSCLEKDEDYIGQFISDCLEHFPDDEKMRISCTSAYDAFKWWWAMNMDAREQRIPTMKTINSSLRERGYMVEKRSGKTWIYSMAINIEIIDELQEFVKRNKS